MIERILLVYGYKYLRADANGFSYSDTINYLGSSIPIYDTLAHCSPPYPARPYANISLIKLHTVSFRSTSISIHNSARLQTLSPVQIENSR